MHGRSAAQAVAQVLNEPANVLRARQPEQWPRIKAALIVIERCFDATLPLTLGAGRRWLWRATIGSESTPRRSSSPCRKPIAHALQRGFAARTPVRGLPARNAEDAKWGAGRYFAPRALIEAIAEVVDPDPQNSEHAQLACSVVQTLDAVNGSRASLIVAD